MHQQFLCVPRRSERSRAFILIFFVGLAHISIKAYLKARSRVIVFAGILLINDNFHKYIMKTHTHRERSPKTLTTPKMLCYLIYMRMPETHLQCGNIACQKSTYSIKYSDI